MNRKCPGRKRKTRNFWRKLLKEAGIDWKTALCAIAGTDITDEEWDANAHTEIPRPTLCPS